MAAPTDRLERRMPSGCLEDMRCAPKAVTGVAHRVASLLTAKGSTDRDGVRGSVRRSRVWSAQALSLTESANAPWDRSILREHIRRRPVARQQYCPIRVGDRKSTRLNTSHYCAARRP